MQIYKRVDVSGGPLPVDLLLPINQKSYNDRGDQSYNLGFSNSDWDREHHGTKEYPSKIFEGHKGSDEDSLIPKDQHASVFHFHAGFDAFRDLFVIQTGLHQALFRIVERLQSGPLLFGHWKRD